MTRTRHLFLGLTVASALNSAVVWAGATPFLINGRASDLNPGNAAQNSALIALNAAADAMQDVVNQGFLAEPMRQAFASGLAKANSSDSSSLIADRGSNASKFSVGMGAQVGMYLQGTSTSTNANNQLPQMGVGAEAGVMLGFRAASLGIPSLGPFDNKRLMLFLSGMGFSTSASGVSASFFNVGLNGLYDLIPAKSIVVFGWGGLKFLTGLNYASNSITYSGKLQQSTSAVNGSDTATMSLNMDYTVGANSKVFYIPLELSTNVTLFYLFTFYAGFSADVGFGSASLTGGGSGPVTAADSNSFGVTNLFSGTGTLNLDDGTTASPSAVTVRGFAGMQFNVYALKGALEATTLANGAKSYALLVRLAL